MLHFSIQIEPLPCTRVFSFSGEDGACITFVGAVRNTNPSAHTTDVRAIEYHCYEELAHKEGLRIITHAQHQYKTRAIYCVHRIGRIALSEASLYIEIISAHRNQGIRALEYIMDTIKQSLPVWKKEITNHGGTTWT